jgi:hypothetical protein
LRLCSPEAAALETAGGGVCAHVEEFENVSPRDNIDALRLDITRRTIADAMITYPALAKFPEVEDAGWAAINAALRGKTTPAQAVESMQRVAEEALR